MNKLILAVLLAICSLSMGAFAQNNITFMPLENEVSFAIISDPHIGMWEPDNAAKMFHYNQDVLRWAIDDINSRSDIAFVLILGDLTKDSEPYNHIKVKEMLDNLRVPYYVIPGNHDVNKTSVKGPKMGIEDFVKIYQGHGYNSNRTYYSVNPVPNIHLVALDSASDPKVSDTWGGAVSQQQLNWLDADLNKTSNVTTIVMIHHALINHTGKNDPNWYVDTRGALNDILRKHGVQIVFSGHLHTTDIAYENGLYDISCPATSTYPLAYRLAKIDGNKLYINTLWYPDELVREIAKAEFLKNSWEGTLQEMEGNFSDRVTTIELNKSLPIVRVPVLA